MMSEPRLLSCLSPLLALSLLGAAAPAHAQSSERAQALKVFAEMRDAALKHLKDVKVTNVKSDKPEVPKTAVHVDSVAVGAMLPKVGVNRVVGTTPVNNIIKVWAELGSGSKKHPGKPTGTAVSLTSYKWKANQEFFLCLETALPVRFTLHANDRTGDTQLLPDPEKLEGLDVILPGKRYVISIPLITDDNDDDEEVTLTVFTVGTREEVKPPVKDDEIVFKGVKAYRDQLDKAYREAKNKKTPTMRSVDVVPGTPPLSKNIDEMAYIGLCKESPASIRLKLRK
jgi:hypothetical protein